MTKPRTYERCTQCQVGKVLISVEDQALCYACIVCLLYADTDTRELAAWLGHSVRDISQVATKYGIHKSAKYMATHSCGRIQPGNVPHNKGLRRPGWSPGRMRETQFKPGERSGIAAKNWCPVGTIRTDAEGYLRIKVREWKPGDKAWGFGNVGIWPLLQRHIWEKAYGPIPAGHVVVFEDGNRSNCAIGNLGLISRRDLMKRNTVHNLPKELAEVIQLSGALKRKLRRICEKQNVGSAEPPVRDARSA